MAREIKQGLWLESSGGIVTIGVTEDLVALGKLSSIETLGVGSKIEAGGPLALFGFPKGREVEVDSPISGRILEVQDVSAVTKDPKENWFLKVDASDSDDEEEDEVDDDADDDDDDE